jgi:hypothetical protein
MVNIYLIPTLFLGSNVWFHYFTLGPHTPVQVYYRQLFIIRNHSLVQQYDIYFLQLYVFVIVN